MNHSTYQNENAREITSEVAGVFCYATHAGAQQHALSLLPNYRLSTDLVPEEAHPTLGDVHLKASANIPFRDTLYRDFRPLVQRLIRKYGDDPELRKDLEGEIFCLFCGLLDAYDPERGVPLRAYLVHQLTTSVYTLARRQWRQVKREVALDLHEDTTQDWDPSRQWDDAMAMAQVRKMLPAAIAQLPQRQRQVVIWRYLEHRSFEEIAEALGVQLATTRSLLRHGVNNLRRSFEKSNLSLDACLSNE